MLVLIMAQLQLTDVHIDMKVLREEHGEKRKRNGQGGGVGWWGNSVQLHPHPEYLLYILTHYDTICN